MKMSFANWGIIPAAVRAQTQQFLDQTQELFVENLVGVYIHGSLAMGCFNPAHSDIDILVVTRQAMSVTTKRQIAEQLLYLSRRPIPIEISYLDLPSLHPWQYPPPFDFHYSEAWRAAYARDLANGAWKEWNTTQKRDPDLAAHITVLRERGITLTGPPIRTLFPAIPRADYVAAIMDDVTSALETILEEPIYAILNTCRTCAYFTTGQIYSKDEGGKWALENLPVSFRPLILQARANYASEAQAEQFSPAVLIRFQEYIRQELNRVRS